MEVTLVRCSVLALLEEDALACIANRRALGGPDPCPLAPNAGREEMREVPEASEAEEGVLVLKGPICGDTICALDRIWDSREAGED